MVDTCAYCRGRPGVELSFAGKPVCSRCRDLARALANLERLGVPHEELKRTFDIGVMSARRKLGLIGGANDGQSLD